MIDQHLGRRQPHSDSSEIPKLVHSIRSGTPLAQCSYEELRHERRYRRRLLDDECARARSLKGKLALWASLGLVGTIVSAKTYGWLHAMTFILAGPGSLAPLALWISVARLPESRFARRQRAAIEEIGFLLREKQGL